MSNLYRGIVLSVLFSLLTVTFMSANAAKACKGLSQSACSKNTDCSWVKSYTTKTGSKVKAYCRTKSGKKSAVKTKTKTSEKKTKKDKKKKQKSNSQ